jgi:hypothetical protein
VSGGGLGAEIAQFRPPDPLRTQFLTKSNFNMFFFVCGPTWGSGQLQNQALKTSPVDSLSIAWYLHDLAPRATLGYESVSLRIRASSFSVFEVDSLQIGGTKFKLL